MKKILLDTNCYAGYLTGDEKVLDAIGRADAVYLSVIVVGELLAGFKGGSREKDNKRILQTFISKLKVEILDVSIETSEVLRGNEEYSQEVRQSYANKRPLDCFSGD